MLPVSKRSTKSARPKFCEIHCKCYKEILLYRMPFYQSLCYCHIYISNSCTDMVSQTLKLLFGVCCQSQAAGCASCAKPKHLVARRRVMLRHLSPLPQGERYSPSLVPQIHLQGIAQIPIRVTVDDEGAHANSIKIQKCDR